MPSMTVTSSGCSSGTWWITTPGGGSGRDRGSPAQPGTVTWMGSWSYMRPILRGAV